MGESTHPAEGAGLEGQQPLDGGGLPPTQRHGRCVCVCTNGPGLAGRISITGRRGSQGIARMTIVRAMHAPNLIFAAFHSQAALHPTSAPRLPYSVR